MNFKEFTVGLFDVIYFLNYTNLELFLLASRKLGSNLASRIKRISTKASGFRIDTIYFLEWFIKVKRCRSLAKTRSISCTVVHFVAVH